ncbi:MAG TPA: glycosyltransferase [Terrimicrobiaceae bacterium]
MVHLIIPAYNEGRRLPNYLPRLCRTLSKLTVAWRITVIDDGSRDEDSRLMQCCAQLCGPRVEFRRLRTNLGKGGAVYAGWDLDQDSQWLGLLDADGAIPSHEVLRMLSLLQQDDAPDALFASRCKILGRTVHRSWLRHLCGRLFATLVAVATEIPVYDSQCGFKLIRRSAYEMVRSRLRERRFAFDVELLYALRKSGAKVIEVPIDWFDVPGSKLHFLRDSAQMLAAVIGMRMRNSKR